MAKLDPVKISWIIQQKQRGTSNQEITNSMKVSVRWIQKLYLRYLSTGIVPVLKQPGRPKRQITEQETSVVVSAFAKYRCCAIFLEKTIRINTGIHIPHNTIHKIFREKKLASEQPKKQRKRKWVRYERTYSNSMWHTDWKQLDDGRWLICYEDDASRFITGYGTFDNVTSENAVRVLRKAIKDHGRPASVLTDHGSQFYANESEYKTRGATEFEKTLVQLGIKHILARVSHPQTNGKLERFHGEIQRKQKWFSGIDELIHWWNHIKPHMSLDWDNLETPYEVFVRKMPEKGSTVIDEQTGEKYHTQ